MNVPKRSLLAALVACAITAGAAVAQDEFETLPLDGVIADMQVAGGRLARFFTDQPTQQKQQDAVDKLDALIKLLEQRRQQRGGRSDANPDEPLPDSIIKAGPGGSGPLHDADRRGGAWGQLPAHKREQILQSMTEGFPPHYQRLLERYYRRLAEERPLDEPPGDGEPADSPDPVSDVDPAAEETPSTQ
jgi:hypothetical protein